MRACTLSVSRSLIAVLVSLTPLLATGRAAGADKPTVPHRTFLFTYQATVTGLPADAVARVWLPVASSDPYQEVKIEAEELPVPGKIGHDPKFGTRILYVETRPDAGGKVHLRMTYRISRREARGDLTEKPDLVPANEFLKPDKRVPIGGPPLDLIKGKELPNDQLKAARVLYDVVNEHMRYSKEGTGWGRGDSVWACKSGYGNCTDFHSLFMSLARSQKIPAKFEIGFPLPEKRGSGEIPGYHCWAFFRPSGHGWIPVDISEANKNPKLRDYYFGHLSENRVAFSTGRDIDLVPKQVGEPVNFFIYPYVEVNSKPYDQVEKQFTYKDLVGD